MLKYTNIELDLITDMDMYLMVEKGIRGGISQISHRYAESNYPGMETYDDKKQKKILTYQDANALYAWAMPQLLPTKCFPWVSPDQVDFLNVPKDSKIGYILEVDLEYPEELHNKHNDYPLAPEHLNITDDMKGTLSTRKLSCNSWFSEEACSEPQGQGKTCASLSKSTIICKSWNEDHKDSSCHSI